jgi:ABC-2 type transport system permease protein
VSLRKYGRLYIRLAIMSFWTQAVSPLSSFGYLIGKLTRIAFFLLFLIGIFKHTDALAGYTLEEAALFFLTFNMVDILAQLFFRGIYGIRGLIREGDYDYYLIQPVNLLWRVSFSTVDFLDVVTILPVLGITAYLLHKISGGFAWTAIGLYALLLMNGLVIAFAIHIVVAALAVLTQELDNTIWIYRDLMTLGRFPSDIYAPLMRGA